MILASAVVVLVSTASAAVAQAPTPMPMAHDSMHHEMRGMGKMRPMNGSDGHGTRMMAMRAGGPGMAGMKGGVASMLLGQTAALMLSDQQVVRLASLARAAESQQAMMRTTMDSMHRAMMGSHATGGAMSQMTMSQMQMSQMQMSPAMDARMKAAHEQMHANVRDALAVLTPDQLATAWESRDAMDGMRMHSAMKGMGGGMQRVERREIITNP
jgi:hypothetical protein